MKPKKCVEETKLYLRKLYNRNGKILNSKRRKTMHNRVNLHWWSMQRTDCVENVGDFLSTVVCNFMLEKKEFSFNDEVGRMVHLYSIGSIIQGGAQHAVIWGSGLKHGTDDIPLLMKLTRKLDVRLVRGPETRKALIAFGYDCPEKYGDPAIIMPLIYQPKKMEKKDYIVILHHNTALEIEGSISPLTSDYKNFIDQICNSKLVITSSLHGIILAETYGVPATLLKDRETQNMYKYNDYYYSTGRYEYPVAESVEEALSMASTDVPDFSVMRKIVMETFPYDLWNK